MNKQKGASDSGDRFPQKLRDLDKETIELLWRLTPEQREAMGWVLGLEKGKRDRLDLFLSLPKDNFEAGFTIVEWWTRLAWLGRTGFWIMGGVVAVLLFFNQVAAFVARYIQDGPP